MRISEERIATLARQVCNALLDEDLIDLEIGEDKFFFLVEQLILHDMRMEDKIDEEAAARLRKQKPYLQDGTPDWEVALEKVKDDLAKSKGYIIR